MAQASGAPLPAVESGEFSAQEPSGNGSKRDEPYKYYDGGHEEVQRQAQNYGVMMPPNAPIHSNYNATKFAAQGDRRQLYEPKPRVYYDQRGETSHQQVNYKRDHPQMVEVKHGSKQQNYVSDGYAYTGPVAPGTSSNNFTLQRPA
jgi:hypothetical protein